MKLILIFNVFFCSRSRFCTSIVSQDKDGNVFHGRNLDYPHPILRNLTVNLVFLRNGKVALGCLDFSRLTKRRDGHNETLLAPPGGVPWNLVRRLHRPVDRAESQQVHGLWGPAR